MNLEFKFKILGFDNTEKNLLMRILKTVKYVNGIH